MSSKYTHIAYQLADSGSHYPFYGVVLYPGVPVDASTLPQGLVTGLLQNEQVAWCDAEGTLAPLPRRFAQSESFVTLGTNASANRTAGSPATMTEPELQNFGLQGEGQRTGG